MQKAAHINSNHTIPYIDVLFIIDELSFRGIGPNHDSDIKLPDPHATWWPAR